jgi:hypothetical protein
MDEGAPMLLPLSERAFLIRSHEPAVASYIGRENGCEPSLHVFAIHGSAP